MHNKSIIVGTVLAMSVYCGAANAGGFTFLKIAETGDAPPDRPTSAFEVFSNPSINQAGQVAFEADIEEVSGATEGVYRFDSGSLIRLVDSAEFGLRPPPGEVSGNFTGISSVVINGGGDVLFYGNTEFSDSEHGVYVYSGPLAGGLIFNDSASQPVPGHPGETFEVFPFLNAERMLLSDTGHNVTIAQFRTPDFVSHPGLYYGDVAGGIVRIADHFVAPPGQPGALFGGPLAGNPPAPSSAFDAFMCMNRVGDAAFNASYNNGAGSGMYRYVGSTATLLRVADSSMQPPNQPGAVFTTVFNFPGMNDAGAVAFKSQYSGGIGAEGLYLGDGIGPITTIVDNSGAFSVPGQPAANFGFFEPPIINGNGDVVFGASLVGGTAGGGLYIKSGGLIDKIVDFSDPVPGQPGFAFNALDRFMLNNAGRVAFRGRYTGANYGIYFYDGLTVSRVIDAGTSLATLGTAYNRFSMLFGFGGSGGQDGKAKTLNESDQIVFRALQNEFQEPQGIFLASPDIPCDVDGDFDGDCDVDSDDRDAFVSVLLGLNNDPDDIATADLSGDGNANGLDIAQFIEIFMSDG